MLGTNWMCLWEPLVETECKTQHSSPCSLSQELSFHGPALGAAVPRDTVLTCWMHVCPSFTTHCTHPSLWPLYFRIHYFGGYTSLCSGNPQFILPLLMALSALPSDVDKQGPAISGCVCEGGISWDEHLNDCIHLGFSSPKPMDVIQSIDFLKRAKDRRKECPQPL